MKENWNTERREAVEPLKVIGYYVCEICEMKDTPDWLWGVGKRVLSVSGCIGEQHPKPKCFMGGWHKGESREYQKALRLNDERYGELAEAARRLFDLKRMGVDSRFYELSDAQAFCKKFCSALNCRVVSVSTTPEYLDVLAEELKGSNSDGRMSGAPDNSLWLGSDILGWDICGFHSFLCNSLQKELAGAKFNDMGLLDNDFTDVILYAKQIEGLGEPVRWIPCKIGTHE